MPRAARVVSDRRGQETDRRMRDLNEMFTGHWGKQLRPDSVERKPRRGVLRRISAPPSSHASKVEVHGVVELAKPVTVVTLDRRAPFRTIDGIANDIVGWVSI